MGSTEFPPIHELMAHRDPVLLLDRVLAHDGVSTSAQLRIENQSWLTREDGSVDAWLALEYMAQAVAAHEGLVALAAGRPLPVGFLVSASGLQLHCARFTRDAQLRVSATRVRGRPGLGALSHQCAVHAESMGEGAAEQASTLLAEGRLSVSLPRNLQPEAS
jgi:predicted hotdog family 3-hydroxylacyl-ACP dehydratase